MDENKLAEILIEINKSLKSINRELEAIRNKL